jgi:hypothetical protein
MTQNVLYRIRVGAIVLAGAVGWSAAGSAQAVTGHARAVQVGPTTLADTGTLGDTGEGRDATLAVGSVPSVLSAEALHAVTVGWPDQVASEASLANLTMTVGTTGISAGVVLARALAVANGPGTASSTVGDLAINGIPVAVTGIPNQRISIPGGRLVINEQIVSASGTTVNALHATVLGVGDVIIASATAGFAGF